MTTFRLSRVLAAAALVILPKLSLAGAEDAIAACSDAGNTIQINQCAYQVASNEEARMKGELAALIGVLGRMEIFFAGATKPVLVRPAQTAQTAWLKYRAAQCQLTTALAMGGSVRGLNVQRCLASSNEERANQLQKMRHQFEAEGY